MTVLLGIALAIVVLVTVLVLLLRRRLREKYAVLWLVIGLAMIVLGLWPGLLGGLAGLLGVQVPSNLLFLLAIVLLAGVALHLSWEMSRGEERIRRLAEEVAILRTEVESRDERRREHEDDDGADPRG
jgi:hypothetical protein